MPISLSSEAKKRKTRVAVNWSVVKQYYLKENLSGHCSLDVVAEHFDLASGSVKNYASNNHWVADLAMEHARIEGKGLSKLTKHLEIDVAEIRSRQISIARLMQKKSVEWLKSIDPKKIPPNVMLKLLELGLSEERKALGFLDILSDPKEKDSVWSVHAAMALKDQVFSLLDRANSIEGAVEK